MLTDYTTYPTIRAILGVAMTEIRDAVLELPLYEQRLLLDMQLLNGTLVTQYATIKAIDAAQRTTLQTRFYSLVQMFSGYSVSVELLGSLEMFAPKRITDGSASVERNVDAWKTLREAVNLTYTRLKAELLALLEQLDPTQPAPASTARRYSANVGLAADPVTGA